MVGPITTFALYVWRSRTHKVLMTGHWTVRTQPVPLATILASLANSYREQHGWLICFRNLVFAPLSEELVFRALMVPFLMYVSVRSYRSHVCVYVRQR